MRRLLSVLSFSVISIVLIAQPQWKFHLAYEDATGARDTIWFIWDTSATFYGLDTALGEIIVSIDTSIFNVWTNNHSSTTYDTIKTVALPYTHDSFGQTIKACHFVLPIIISWDSSLFHADWLPPEPVGWVNYARLMNDYFFWINNNPLIHYFDMTLDNHVMAPDTNITDPWFWDPQAHFPMNVYITQDPTVGIQDINSLHEISINLSPNPAINNIFFSANTIFHKAQILDLTGKEVLTELLNVNEASINISKLPPGIYIIHFTSYTKKHYYEKFIKTD